METHSLIHKQTKRQSSQSRMSAAGLVGVSPRLTEALLQREAPLNGPIVLRVRRAGRLELKVKTGMRVITDWGLLYSFCVLEEVTHTAGQKSDWNHESGWAARVWLKPNTSFMRRPRDTRRSIKGAAHLNLTHLCCFKAVWLSFFWVFWRNVPYRVQTLAKTTYKWLVYYFI